MTFHSFEISELGEDADNDFQVDMITGDARLGFCATEAEMRMLSDAFGDAVEDIESLDGRHAEEYEEAA